MSARRTLWTACASHGYIHVAELAVPALLVLIQAELGAGDFGMGRVVTLYGLLFGVGALPAGWLVDRAGSRVLLAVCLWGAAVGLFGMALAPSLVTLAAASALMGLALSIYHPAGTALLTHAVAVSGRVFAIHGMAGNLGVAGAGAIAGGLGALLGWRWALAGLAVGGVALGFVALSLPAAALHEIRARRGRGSRTDFLLLLAGVLFMGMVYRGVTTFLPKYLAGGLEREAGVAVGGALTTAALLVGLAGMWIAGRVTDSGVRASRVFLMATVMQLPFLLALGHVAPGLRLPAAMGLAFFHFFTQPPGNQMVAEFTPPRLRGLGYGLYFFTTFGVGSLGAALGGWVSERVGLAQAFPVLALLLLPSVFFIAVLSFGRRRVVPSPEPDARPAAGSPG